MMKKISIQKIERVLRYARSKVINKKKHDKKAEKYKITFIAISP